MKNRQFSLRWAKRFLSLFLVFVLCFWFSGCGNKEANLNEAAEEAVSDDSYEEFSDALAADDDGQEAQNFPEEESEEAESETGNADAQQGSLTNVSQLTLADWDRVINYTVDSQQEEGVLHDYVSGEDIEPAFAYAILSEDIGEKNSLGTFFYRSKTPEVPEYASDYPEVCDLRDYGLVTPVKSQSPWGSCWAFGASAASETSILASLGATYDDTGINLSEHHIAWFALSHLDETHTQAGEGIHFSGSNSEHMDFGSGGVVEFFLYSMGIGPANEEDFPYTNSDGARTESGDWSFPDEARIAGDFQLKNGNLLPETVILNDDNKFDHYDENAILCIKDELASGRAVQIAYELGAYSSPYYGHYSENVRSSNHEVCIVGWDDTFPKEHFARENDPIPEKDGAWIVKNSWGAETPGSDEPLHRFGVENADGQATGYFYLSYYDRSVNTFKSYDFDTQEYCDILQYDYMQNDEINGWTSPDQVSTANIFTASEDGTLRYASFMTPVSMTALRYSVYLLDSSAKVPTDGQLVSQTADYYPYGGFHRTELSDPVPLTAGQRFSIVVDAYTEGSDTPGYLTTATYARNHDKEEPDEKIYHSAVINPGESWLYTGRFRQWIDYKNFIDTSGKDFYDYDNFPIRAYISR